MRRFARCHTLVQSILILGCEWYGESRPLHNRFHQLPFADDVLLIDSIRLLWSRKVRCNIHVAKVVQSSIQV
jgi:hypothetical protein